MKKVARGKTKYQVPKTAVKLGQSSGTVKYGRFNARLYTLDPAIIGETKEELDYLIEFDSKKDRFKCTACNKQFKFKVDLMNHLMTCSEKSKKIKEFKDKKKK